jgi:hypothetical protein
LNVEQTSLLIRMEFSYFDDYWLPFTRGEGPPGQFFASLSDTARSALQEHVQRAYLVSLPDGPRVRVRGMSLSWDRSSVTAPPRETTTADGHMLLGMRR